MSDYTLTRAETETTITWNDADREEIVYTCNKALIRKLDRLCGNKPDTYKVKKQDEYSKTYSVPKKLISICTPRILTDEQKEKISERMRKLHQS